MKKVLCLSAPPFAGKDTFANAICNQFKNVQHKKYAKILKERTHALYGRSSLPYDYFEGDTKDSPNDIFFGITPRQAYINTSELLMKPVHGKTIWSDMLIAEVRESEFEHFVISDCGFQTEWDELQKCEDIKSGLVTISRERCNYNNDSRGPIITGGILNEWELENNEGQYLFEMAAVGIASLFFGSD